VDEDWHLTARGWYSAYERTSWRQAGGSFGEVTPDANVLVRQTQLFRTGAFDLRVRRDIGDHVVTLGAMAFRSSSPVRVDKGASNADFDGTAGAISRVSRKGDVLAAFAEAKFDLGRLQLVPGVRLERLRQRVTERLDLALGSVTGGAPGAPNGQLGRRRNAQAVLLWGLGATLDARPGLRLVGNASRGFKPLLYNDGVTFQAGIDAAEEFEASYATSLEAGVQWRPFRAARIDASLFRVELDDQVGFPRRSAARRGAFRNRRRGRGKAAECGIHAQRRTRSIRQPGCGRAARAGRERGWHLADRRQCAAARCALPLGAGGGLSAAICARAGDARLGTVDRHVGPAGGLAVDSGRQAERLGQWSSRVRHPAYEVVDLSFDLPIAGPLTLGAGVTNLFDAAYWARVRPGAGQGIDPGRSRQAYLSFGARF
jgi:outer membrane receptor protein involved in Fe transport